MGGVFFSAINYENGTSEGGCSIFLLRKQQDMTNKRDSRFTREEYEQIIEEYQNKSDEELLDVIRSYSAQLGRPPIKAEVPAAEYIKDRLGPWPRALERAGVKEVSPTYERKIMRRKIKREARRLKHIYKGNIE